MQERLLEATKQGKLQLVKECFPEGCDYCEVANTKDDEGRTAIHWATIKDYPEIVLFLFEKGADIFTADKYGDLAIHLAARLGKFKITEFFLQHMDPDIRTHRGSWTPLHCASWKGHIGVIQHLLALNADINAQDSQKDTPLHWAARYGQLEVVQLLIERGADVNKRDEDGDAPYHYAAANGNLEIFQYLENNGGRIDARNNAGDMPIHWAAIGGSVPMVEHLIKQGIDPDVLGEHDWTALHRAAWRGKLGVVSFLATRGASLNIRDASGRTALHWAVDGRRGETVKLLLASGADASVTAINGKTARDWPDADETIKQLFDHIVHRNPNIAGKEGANRQTAPFLLDEELNDVFDRKACVTYYLKDGIEQREVSVYDLIYRGKLYHDTMKPEEQDDASRWIHLPLNRMKWVLDLIDRICHMDREEESYCKRIKSFVNRNERDRVAVVREAGSRESHFQYEGPSVWNLENASPEDPCHKSLSGPSMISAVLPYFDIESISSFAKFQDEQSDLFEKCPDHRDLYSRPTLDRLYYVGLSDTRERDMDQVLTKMLKLRVARSLEKWKPYNRPVIDVHKGMGEDRILQAMPTLESLVSNKSSTHCDNSRHNRGKGDKEASLNTPQSLPDGDEDTVKETRKERKDAPDKKIHEENLDTSRLLMVPQLWMWMIDKRKV